MIIVINIILLIYCYGLPRLYVSFFAVHLEGKEGVGGVIFDEIRFTINSTDFWRGISAIFYVPSIRFTKMTKPKLLSVP